MIHILLINWRGKNNWSGYERREYEISIPKLDFGGCISLGFSSPAGTIPPYKFSFGGFAQFSSMDIGPGSSFDFLFGTFSSDLGPIPAGTYHPYAFGGSYGDPVGLQINFVAPEGVTINVSSVPEPSTAVLIVAALIAAARSRLRKRIEAPLPLAENRIARSCKSRETTQSQSSGTCVPFSRWIDGFFRSTTANLFLRNVDSD
jgi:hypothetical protein